MITIIYFYDNMLSSSESIILTIARDESRDKSRDCDSFTYEISRTLYFNILNIT